MNSDNYHLDEMVLMRGDNICFLACLYESTGSYCCHPDLGVGVGAGMGS